MEPFMAQSQALTFRDDGHKSIHRGCKSNVKIKSLVFSASFDFILTSNNQLVIRRIVNLRSSLLNQDLRFINSLSAL